MGEVRGRSNQEDRVRVDEARDTVHINLVGRRRARYQVDLDLEVVTSLSEGRVRSVWENPIIAVLVMNVKEGLLDKVAHISGSVTPRSAYAFCRAL